jgi:hypothetical protein
MNKFKLPLLLVFCLATAAIATSSCSTKESKVEPVQIFELDEKIKKKFEAEIVPNDTDRYCIHHYSLSYNENYFYLIKRDKRSSLSKVGHLTTIINGDSVYIFTGIERFAKEPELFSSQPYVDTYVVKDSIRIVCNIRDDVYLHIPPAKKSTVRFLDGHEE